MLPTFVTHSRVAAGVIDAGGVDYLVAALHDGLTLSAIARKFGGSRAALTYWINTLSPADQERIREADKGQAATFMEESIQIADALAEEVRTYTKPMYVEGAFVADLTDVAAVVAAEKERIKVRQTFAERKDKDTWGLRPTTEVTVNNNTMFLDALRRVNSTPPAVPAALAQATLIAPSEIQTIQGGTEVLHVTEEAGNIRLEDLL